MPVIVLSADKPFDFEAMKRRACGSWGGRHPSRPGHG
jgi:hypothetical protein